MSSYFENDVCKNIVDEINENIPEYDIFFMSNSNSVEEFASTKLCQYDKTSIQYGIYQKLMNEGITKNILLKRKRTDTTGIIKQHWEKSVNDGSFFLNFVSLENVLPKGFHEKSKNIHSLLGGLAYIPDHINKILLGNMSSCSPLGSRISGFINKSYFSSYLDVLSPCAVVTELRILHSDYVDIDKYQLHIPYTNILRHLSSVKILEKIVNGSFSSIYKMKNDDKIISEIAKAIEKYFFQRRELRILNHQTINNYGNIGAMGNAICNDGLISA